MGEAIIEEVTVPILLPRERLPRALVFRNANRSRPSASPMSRSQSSRRPCKQSGMEPRGSIIDDALRLVRQMSDDQRHEFMADRWDPIQIWGPKKFPAEKWRMIKGRGDIKSGAIDPLAAPTGGVRLPLGIRACRWWCDSRHRCERWRCVPRPRHAVRWPHAAGAASACSAFPCGRPLPWRAPGPRWCAP